MSSSDSNQVVGGAAANPGGAGSAEVKFTVTSEPGTEIFVLDGSYRVVEHGLDELSASLPPGLYKVKLQAGRQAREEYLSLRPGESPVSQHYAAPGFASSAPLINTLATHEYHREYAETRSRSVDKSLGAGSGIFVFARYWTGNTTSKGLPSPAADLGLWDLSGREVVRLADAAWKADVADPCAACNIELPPGTYRLRVTLPDGDAFERAIVAAPRWQTQVFLTRSGGRASGADRPDVDLARAAVFMARPSRGFDASGGEQTGTRLVDLATKGLGDRRVVVSRQQLDHILGGKFENPMLGILGAHLLLLDAEPDRALLEVVVGNLRRLFRSDDPLGGGFEHPDVEALSLYLGAPAAKSAGAQRGPPMLDSSWDIILGKTAEAPGLIPPGSLAGRIADRVIRGAPWLLWRAPLPESESVPESAEGPESMPRPAPQMSLEQAFHEAKSRVAELEGLDLNGLEESLLSVVRSSELVPESGGGFTLVQRWRRGSREGAKEISLDLLVRQLRVPVSTIHAALTNMLRTSTPSAEFRANPTAGARGRDDDAIEG